MSVKAVLDTNVIVSAFWSDSEASPPYRIYCAMMANLFVPLFNNTIIAEYDEVLRRERFKFPSWKVDALIDFVKESGERIFPVETDSASFPDPDDKVFYCTALAAQDDGAVLVTGNVRHFPSAPFVVTPAEFAERLKTF